MIPAVSSGSTASQSQVGVEPPLQGVTPLEAAPASRTGDETPEAILITAPSAGQGVRGTIHIEGLSDPALAQQLNVLVRDAKGTVIVTAQPVVQSAVNQRGSFSTDVTLPANLPAQAGRIAVYAISPRDGGITHLTSADVQLNGDGNLAVPIDPQTPEAITIAFPNPGAEVKGMVKVAAATLLGPRVVVEIRDANDQTVGRVEQTLEQTTGTPAQVLAEVPIQVSATGPGRVLVYVVNARDGSTEHLNSVEVNLIP
jgi:hypothetical protein